VIIESRLQKWIQAGLTLYAAQPVMIEQIFYDAAQAGWPSVLGPGQFGDREKRWIPGEYAGGTLRWAGASFPILDNTATLLTVDGDPALLQPQTDDGYQIVPPDVAGLTELLRTNSVQVLTAFAQVPTQLPAMTIRLERDSQGDTYVGEDLTTTVDEGGTEVRIVEQEMVGAYLLSIWTVNRESTLWLYAWLQNYILNSLTAFSTWGLHDVRVSGSDLDPALQYLAERAYTRHLLLTAARIERAVTLASVEWVHDYRLCLFTAYARLAATWPQPMA